MHRRSSPKVHRAKESISRFVQKYRGIGQNPNTPTLGRLPAQCEPHPVRENPNEQVVVITMKEPCDGMDHKEREKDKKKADTIIRPATTSTNGSQLLETMIEQENVLNKKKN